MCLRWKCSCSTVVSSIFCDNLMVQIYNYLSRNIFYYNFSTFVTLQGPREGCVRLSRSADILHFRSHRNEGLDNSKRNDGSSGRYCNVISSSSAKYIENVKMASAKLVIIMWCFFFVFCTGCWSDSL